MKHKMLKDRVLVEPVTENVSAGGIFIPDATKERPVRGKIVLAGPHVVEANTGDEVLFGEYSGIKTTLEGKEYLIMKEEDIFMILKN